MRRLAITWLAIYPIITAVQWILGPHIAQLALPLRTMIVVTLVVPVMVFLALPLVSGGVSRLERRRKGRAMQAARSSRVAES